MGPRGCLKGQGGTEPVCSLEHPSPGECWARPLSLQSFYLSPKHCFSIPKLPGISGLQPAEESPGTPLLLCQSCPGTAAVWRVTQQAAAAWWGGLNFFLALSATRLGEDNRGGSLGSGRSSSWLDNGGTRSWGTGPALWRGDCSQALPSPGLESRKTPMRERRAPGL